MLDLLRSKTKSPFIQGTILIIVLVFIFWGVGSSYRGTLNTVATVNKQPIDYEAFKKAYDRIIDQYRGQFGGSLPKGLVESLGLEPANGDSYTQDVPLASVELTNKPDLLIRGGKGEDVLYAGSARDRLYGGLGADRFVFEIDSMETDEVIDFNPAENDTVWLQRKYSDSSFTADSIRIDGDGDLEVQLANENWSNIVNLHQNNLEFDIDEFSDGLRLRFIKRF